MYVVQSMTSLAMLEVEFKTMLSTPGLGFDDGTANGECRLGLEFDGRKVVVELLSQVERSDLAHETNIICCFSLRSKADDTCTIVGFWGSVPVIGIEWLLDF